MSSEILFQLPMPGTKDFKGCRLGGERFGEALGDRYVACIRLAERRGVLTGDVSDQIFSSAWRDMAATARNVIESGFVVVELRHFWRGMRRGYKRAMASAVTLKIH